MLNLIPETLDFQISTTDLSVKYTERGTALIELEVIKREHFINREKYTAITLCFDTVAELKCCSLNFHEANHKNFEIFDVTEGGDSLEFWKKNGYHPDSGLYRIDKSEWLMTSKSKYAPQDSLDLTHFLVVGNDSYIELLAKGYKIE